MNLMNENHELIGRALDYARSDFARSELTLQEVADHAGFSIDYFNRIFLAHTGFTVMAYVNHLRLKRGAMLLRFTDKTVLDIALETGYDSHEGFSRAFRKHYGANPSDYRAGMKDRVLTWGDLTDPTAAARFIHRHPGLTPLDSDQVIDDLLEKSGLSWGYPCSGILGMGYQPARDEEGNLFLIGDDRQGGIFLELIPAEGADIAGLLAAWPGCQTIYSPLPPDAVGIAAEGAPMTVYRGENLPADLPEGITVRPLTADDLPAIRDWAEHWTDGRQEGYVRHLLTASHYADDRVLEYGIFAGEVLLAAVGCGIERVRGLQLNDCALIRFRDGAASDALYRAAYCAIVNDLLAQGILPYDDRQHGDYARSHGNFTAAELGFETVLWRYSCKSAK